MFLPYIYYMQYYIYIRNISVGTWSTITSAWVVLVSIRSVDKLILDSQLLRELSRKWPGDRGPLCPVFAPIEDKYKAPVERYLICVNSLTPVLRTLHHCLSYLLKCRPFKLDPRENTFIFIFIFLYKHRFYFRFRQVDSPGWSR